jgi:hypothetical protein
MKALFRTVCVAALLLPCAAQAATKILFIGNSFTFGANSPAMHYRSSHVHDLNNEDIGGVPALFEAFTREAGLDYDVSLETSPGRNFDFHYTEKLGLIDRPWDVVVMQGYSTLDAKKPGNAANLVKYGALLADVFHKENPNVALWLDATWSRPDQTYPESGHWHGQPIEQMALDLRKGYDQAKAASPWFKGVLPVGQAFNLAIKEGVADPNPYDGIAFGQLDLWSWDHYHASGAGYYLEALVEFGAITGKDPMALGAREPCAADMGLSPAQAAALQKVAHDILVQP